MKLVLTFFFFSLPNLIKKGGEIRAETVMKHLAIWILGLIECLILLMMKFIKVLEGEIYADSAAKSGKLIKIPGDISVIRGTGLLTLAPLWAGELQRGRAYQAAALGPRTGRGPPKNEGFHWSTTKATTPSPANSLDTCKTL